TAKITLTPDAASATQVEPFEALLQVIPDLSLHVTAPGLPVMLKNGACTPVTVEIRDRTSGTPYAVTQALPIKVGSSFNVGIPGAPAVPPTKEIRFVDEMGACAGTAPDDTIEIAAGQATVTFGMYVAYDTLMNPNNGELIAYVVPGGG